MAADLELDSTKEAAEAQIAAPTGALGRYAPLIAAFCRSKCVESEEIIIWKVSFAEQRLQSNTAASNCQGSAIIARPVANSVAFSRSALCWCQARLATPRLSMACSVSERRLLIIILDEKHVHVRLPLQRLNGRGREAEVSALLALTKLMAVDAGFCEANLRLAFTLLHNRCVPSGRLGSARKRDPFVFGL